MKLWDLKEDFNRIMSFNKYFSLCKRLRFSWQSIMQLKLESISNDLIEKIYIF